MNATVNMTIDECQSHLPPKRLIIPRYSASTTLSLMQPLWKTPTPPACQVVFDFRFQKWILADPSSARVSIQNNLLLPLRPIWVQANAVWTGQRFSLFQRTMDRGYMDWSVLLCLNWWYNHIQHKCCWAHLPHQARIRKAKWSWHENKTRWW